MFAFFLFMSNQIQRFQYDIVVLRARNSCKLINYPCFWNEKKKKSTENVENISTSTPTTPILAMPL